MFLLLVILLSLSVSKADNNILVLTDLHYDNQYVSQFANKSKCRVKNSGAPDIRYSTYGCDSSQALIDDSLRSLSDLKKNISLLLMLGDLPAHDLPTYELNRNASAYTAEVIRKNFDQIKTLPVVGNNEAYGDYELSASGNLDPQLVDLLAIYLKNNWLNDLYRNNFSYQCQTFLKGGYYYYDDTKTKTRYIILSTVYYSFKFEPSFITKENNIDILNVQDPMHQFKFLEETLFGALVKKLKVQILMHIGPGCNGYDYKQCLWVPEYHEKFNKILNKYKKIIEAMQIGHFHQDMFRYTTVSLDSYKTDNDSISGFIHPSISPSNQNNPGVRTYKINNDGVIEDYTQYFSDLQNANRNYAKDKTKISYKIQYSFFDYYEDCITKTENINGFTLSKLNESLRDPTKKCWTKWWLASTMLFNNKKYNYACSSLITNKKNETETENIPFDVQIYEECLKFYGI